MSGTVLSAYGLDDFVLLLIVGGVLLFIIMVTIFIWSSGSLGTFLNGVDKSMKQKAVYDKLPELREIARLYPDEKIGIETQKFLERWDKEIEPSLKHMSHDRRKKVLRGIYQTTITPILKAYEEILEP